MMVALSRRLRTHSRTLGQTLNTPDQRRRDETCQYSGNSLNIAKSTTGGAATLVAYTPTDQLSQQILVIPFVPV
jgi:hypothetical protein